MKTPDVPIYKCTVLEQKKNSIKDEKLTKVEFYG